MPEENWAAHGGIQACDLCHARKVKCDRKEPCSNCITAKTQCLRNRHKRAPKPKIKTDDKIQALVQRLSTLEDSVRSKQHTPSAVAVPESSITPEGSSSADRALKRKRANSSIHGGTVSSTPEVDTTQQTAEARSLISKELSTNDLLSGHQRSVLETAISFVDHLSHAPVPAIADRSTYDASMQSTRELSHGEILNVILSTETKSADCATIDFHMLDHVPPKAVERIGLALMEGNADEKTLTLYRVVIYFKAAVVLYANNLYGSKSEEVQKHIKEMEYEYMSAALTALDNVSFLTPPSLLLVQALVTGAIMMQIMGNPASCWELTAHASRTIVALGYHTIKDSDPKTENDEEIHAVVAWCAQFDSCMSLLLVRPRSLPPLAVNVASIIKPNPANPMSIFEIMAMEMVPMHNKILDLTLEVNMKRPPTSLGDEVASLRKAMSDLYTLMHKQRPVHLLDTNMVILLHWKCLEFKYFSTLASVHRLSPTVTTNPFEREECLQSARKALECVKVIEDISKSLGHFMEGYDPYLAWTMLSYPLCPFFVVFCNVVGTSNAHDFQLLQDVTDGISALVTENKFVNRLHRLCATLLSLCKPLVPTPVLANIHLQPQPQHNNGIIPDLSPSPISGGVPHGVPAPQMAPVGSDMSLPMQSDGDVNMNGNGEFISSSWNDGMMWQLFQSQPSLDWFNADILDPTWDFNIGK